ncbi:MAG TPA: sugar ABC transporter permease [Candidatus Limnocylindrales bacterium]|nr:sugar ABC transporter permease [Candidatus Limnocylindrales bacterium]
MSALSPGGVRRPRFRHPLRGSGLTPYLFILPHTIFFAAFLAWPFFFGIYTSLFEFDFLRPERRPFVGLQNYLNLIQPESIQFRDFWRSMRNTGEFLVWSVPPLVTFALFLAVLLNGRFRGRNVFRMIYFAPYTLSVTAASVLWWWIFQPQGGLLNHYLEMIGIDGPNWLSSMPEAWAAITIATVWWTIGFNTIIFLAALQEIPVSLYEAAAIDGANRWQQFRYVTIPMLRPVLVLVVTITVIASANLFGQPYIMTGGGPLQRTEPIVYRIYVEGVLRNQMGSAAAMSVVVAALLLVVTALNFRLFGRRERD